MINAAYRMGGTWLQTPGKREHALERPGVLSGWCHPGRGHLRAAAANTLVARLADLGILSEMTGYARNRRFRYAPYIDLFMEGA
jgi:hypothetical protein